MSAPSSEDGWLEYQRLVLGDLKRLDGDLRDLRRELAEAREELSQKIEAVRERIQEDNRDRDEAITTLKVRAGLWGLIGGAIPVAIALALQFLRHP